MEGNAFDLITFDRILRDETKRVIDHYVFCSEFELLAWQNMTPDMLDLYHFISDADPEEEKARTEDKAAQRKVEKSAIGRMVV